ncbi:imm11 family protein [Pelistega sp. MC2]|uniref:imm11 family protein n=1 Tax=Pelistega sp. MC2 TaxID=1720297 RepID=UPI0008D95710|nr:hypothetical protein [Pelistega sp. MC2]
MIQKLFLIEYDDTCQGCPAFVGGKFYKDNIWTGDHEWNVDDPNPDAYRITSKYSLKMDESSLNLDYSGHMYVSENFLKILDEYEVEYRAIPLEIFLRQGKKTEKAYFYLLLKGRVFLLDKVSSIYTIAMNPNDRSKQLFEEFFPEEPVYDSIEKFSIKKDENFPDFFICQELQQEVCTEKFKVACEERGIIGIRFSELVDGFKYDPMEFWPPMFNNNI